MVEGNEASRIVLDEAREAWKYHVSGISWHKWIAIGRGLQECQRLALERANANDMTSDPARKAMAKILVAEGLDVVDKGDRSVLLVLMTQLPAITAWLATLTATERMRYNHPRTVMKRFTQATEVPAPKPDAAATPRGYKAAFQEAEAKNSILEQRLKTEGSLFNLQLDTPDQIAMAMVGNVRASRAESIARAVLNLLAKRKQRGHAG